MKIISVFAGGLALAAIALFSANSIAGGATTNKKAYSGWDKAFSTTLTTCSPASVLLNGKVHFVWKKAPSPGYALNFNTAGVKSAGDSETYHELSASGQIFGSELSDTAPAVTLTGMTGSYVEKNVTDDSVVAGPFPVIFDLEVTSPGGLIEVSFVNLQEDGCSPVE